MELTNEIRKKELDRRSLYEEISKIYWRNKLFIVASECCDGEEGEWDVENV